MLYMKIEQLILKFEVVFSNLLKIQSFKSDRQNNLKASLRMPE